jgi:heme exporter protein CcmD
MNWSSLVHFLQMGGYGAFVWPAYALALAWMVAEPLAAARRHARTLDALREGGLR